MDFAGPCCALSIGSYSTELPSVVRAAVGKNPSECAREHLMCYLTVGSI